MNIFGRRFTIVEALWGFALPGGLPSTYTYSFTCWIAMGDALLTLGVQEAHLGSFNRNAEARAYRPNKNNRAKMFAG